MVVRVVVGDECLNGTVGGLGGVGGEVSEVKVLREGLRSDYAVLVGDVQPRKPIEPAITRFLLDQRNPKPHVEFYGKNLLDDGRRFSGWWLP
jgi:hypothetical protein